MTTVADLVTRYIAEHPVGNMLDVIDLTAIALRAVRFYQGFAVLVEHKAIPIDDPAPVPPVPFPEITELTDINNSEWAIISPLFCLYVEQGNAYMLEASRGMGVDVFGRSVSEIQSDITQYHDSMPLKAFERDIVSI